MQARGLTYAVLAGSRRAAVAPGLAVGYAALAIVVALVVLKPPWRDCIGLFRNAGGIVARPAGAQDLLGWWSMPLALLLAGLLYLALTKGLRAVRHQPGAAPVKLR